MGSLRKDPTRKQGLFSKALGRRDGLTGKGKVRTQDTGRAFGGVTPKRKPMRKMGGAR